MRRSILLIVLAGVCACSRAGSTPPMGNDAAPLPVPSASSVSNPSPPTAASSAAPAEEPKGTAQLVMQTVQSVCSMGPGEAARYGLIGTDLFVELTEEGASKPTKEFAFCPSAEKPKKPLQTWQNCSAFPSCKADDAAAVCGKERVWIDVSGGKTVLHGSFGERVIAPHPMKILPLKKSRREALVDC